MSVKRYIISGWLLLAAMFVGCTTQAPEEAAGDNAAFHVYVGTYTRGNSEGIYAYRFEPATGTLTSIGLVAKTDNPTFLAVDPTEQFLYAANEVGDYEGEKAGSVSAFSIDGQTGKLTLLNRVSSRGDGPCHLIVDETGKCVIAANYGGGSVASFPVKEGGSLGEAATFVQHTGSSVDPRRQKGPHAHGIALTPDNRIALVADLGLDKVLAYKLDTSTATLTPSDPPFTTVAPGSGPRHLTFHPNGKIVYVINEMASTISVFTYDSTSAALEETQTISTLPDGFDGRSSTAEIAVHPSGKFVYGSNRGHDSIAVFAVEAGTGALTLVEHVSTQGKTPRNFAVDPTGEYLFAANQDTNNIVLFRIDQETGRLTATGDVLEVQMPVCIVFSRTK